MTQTKRKQAAAPPKKRPKRPKKRHLWLRIIKWLLLLVVAGLLAGGGLFAWYARSAPDLTEADLKRGGSSIVYGSKNEELTVLGSQKREYVNANQIPQQLKDAVVAIEDRRFYKERFGVDPIRIASAALNNLMGKSKQGGSTLTQQLVKLSVFSTKVSDQTIKRKAQEAWLAMQLEQKYSKAQILEYYVNKVYMNYSQYGMGTGAKYYFGKALKDVSLPQAAFLAGLAQAPVSYDPYLHPQAATNRRNTVINAMLATEKITQEEADAAKATPITEGLVQHKVDPTVTGTDKVIDAYLTEVIKEVKSKLKVDPYTTNLKIYTNLDMDAQRTLYDIVNGDQLYFPDDQFQTAVTMTDPNNGHVLAQIGGRKTGDVRMAFNRATRNNRSNGSTMKPLMDYGPAIEYLNWSTAQPVKDTPFIYPGTDIQLYNWDKRYQGTLTMRQALVRSRNVPAVRTLEKVGIKKAVNFLDGLGIKLPSDQQYLSAGIGASVTTEQSAAAYGAMANGGRYYKPSYVKSVTDAQGNTTKFGVVGTRAMKGSTAYMLTDMLKGVLTDTQGTASTAAIPGLPAAGKTGTTDYSEEELQRNPQLTGLLKDAWFTGYTRNRVISVWTGYDKPLQAGLTQNQSYLSQMIWKLLMAHVSQNLDNSDWVRPDSVSQNGPELYLTGTQPVWTAPRRQDPVVSSSAESSSSESESESNSESSSESSQASDSASASSESSASHSVTPPASSSVAPPASSSQPPVTPPASSTPPATDDHSAAPAA